MTLLPIIRFPHTSFSLVRSRLFEEAPDEAFAVLFGKRESAGSQRIIKIVDIKFAVNDDYAQKSSGHVRLRPDFVYNLLREASQRLDIDTIIDVHTHPFATDQVRFSGIDDADEIRFAKFLADKFPDIHYASIVLSRSQYSARVWDVVGDIPKSSVASIKTQTLAENWQSSDQTDGNDSPNLALFSRAVLLIGVDHLSRIAKDQQVAVVGLGGLGSVIAENLVHMGFRRIDLIDPDELELSNLSRVVGATYSGALAGEPKVDAVLKHLKGINPDAIISAFKSDIADPALEARIAIADWIVVATDNHSSRLRCQLLSFKYFVPMVSAGVNITVNDGRVTDMSGEVITVRIGDKFCLSCLRRINSAKIASETHASHEIRAEIVRRGYVSGLDAKEPAVKTLNSVVGALLTDTIVNQYTERQRHVPILVYESNLVPCIYEDTVSLNLRQRNCYVCS